MLVLFAIIVLQISFVQAMEEEIPAYARLELSPKRVLDLREYEITYKKGNDCFQYIADDNQGTKLNITSDMRNNTIRVKLQIRGISQIFGMSDNDKLNMMNRLKTYCRDAERR